MFGMSIGAVLKGLAKEIVPLIIASVIMGCIGAVVFLSARSCDSDTAGPDFLEDARDGVLDNVTEQRAENDRRLMELEAEVFDLRLQVEALDAEITESVIQREEIHDAIDQAVSIDDIDRILRGGIPGISGR